MSLVRMYRDTAARIALQLAVAKARLGEPSVRDLRDWAYEHVRGSQKPIKFLDNVLHNEEISQKTTDEIVESLGEQLYAIGHKAQHDNDLIETIVRVLDFPFAQNVLAGKTLDALRKAILVPEELAGLKAKLQKEERHCAGCGKDLMPGELVTYASSGFLSEGRQVSSVAGFYCAVCQMPTYISGPVGCEHLNQLTKLAVKWLKKSMQCGVCAGTSKPVDEGQEVVLNENPFGGPEPAVTLTTAATSRTTEPTWVPAPPRPANDTGAWSGISRATVGRAAGMTQRATPPTGTNPAVVRWRELIDEASAISAPSDMEIERMRMLELAQEESRLRNATQQASQRISFFDEPGDPSDGA